jgi:hypothetical protein
MVAWLGQKLFGRGRQRYDFTEIALHDNGKSSKAVDGDGRLTQHSRKCFPKQLDREPNIATAFPMARLEY